MRRHRLVALAVSSAALALGAGPAMADTAPSAQLAEQVAANGQNAQSSATSTQYKPSNQNISVRVLSPGDNGSVNQSNTSAAESYAGNLNATAQAVEQSQSGGGGGVGIQEAGQKAVNLQNAVSNAESTQIKPSNQNISVRVLSPGDDGDVTQSNDSSAKSGAKNANKLSQSIDQDQSGGACCVPKKGGSEKGGEDAYEKGDDPYEKGGEDAYEKGDDPYEKGGHEKGGKDDYEKGGKDGYKGRDCCHDSVGIQAAGQAAFSKQNAESSAESKQFKPENKNLSVRVFSEGDDGDVTQSNESAALSKALNANLTHQDIDQSQGGSSCGCHGAVGIQAAGQKAVNWQNALSDATSKQFYPSNKNGSLRFKSRGGGGDVTQTNASFAASFAANLNALHQAVSQTQGTARR
jgi:hypothetical protein